MTSFLIGAVLGFAIGWAARSYEGTAVTEAKTVAEQAISKAKDEVSKL